MGRAFSTPPHPDNLSGDATNTSAMATVLRLLFGDVPGPPLTVTSPTIRGSSDGCGVRPAPRPAHTPHHRTRRGKPYFDTFLLVANPGADTANVTTPICAIRARRSCSGARSPDTSGSCSMSQKPRPRWSAPPCRRASRRISRQSRSRRVRNTVARAGERWPDLTYTTVV
jgi:hypothetical protein